MSTKTKIGMWMFTLLAVAFAGIDARGGFIHLDTPDWGSPHAEFHMVTGLFYTLALCAIVVILTWIPLKRGDGWAWWTIALAAITIHGGHFLGDTMTDGGLSQSQAAQGAGIMFLRLSGLAGTPQDDPAFAEPPMPLGDVVVDRYDSRVGHDDYTQPGNLYRLFDEGQRDRLAVKVRSLSRPAPARFDGEAVHFEAPEYGVAPGQAAVIYAGDRVLGGGWIEETVPAELEPA